MRDGQGGRRERGNERREEERERINNILYCLSCVQLL